MLWPDTRVIPFHYPHPVTGKQVEQDDLRAPHFGKDVNTADPALTLALPKDQQDAINKADAPNGTAKSGNTAVDVKELKEEIEKTEIAA